MTYKICRLCCENGATSNIFSTETNGIGLCAKIMYCCSNIDIKVGDGLPSLVCCSCEQELAACYQFVLRCEESDRKLRQNHAANVFSLVIAEFDELKPKTEVKTEIIDTLDDDHQYENSHNTELELDCKQDKLEMKFVAPKCYKKPYNKCKKYKRMGSMCSVCGRRCASAASLLIHMRSHTNEKPYCCLSCDKKYKDSGTLKRHMERNHMEKRKRNFICEHCGKGFYSKSCVKIHMRTHTGETPYACSECPAQFTQIGAMLRHKKRHTGQKDHICPTCSKQFCTKQELTTHLSVHNNERKFTCPICSVAFKQNNNLKRHIREHSELNSFVCNYCGRTFRAKGNLKTHIDKKHSEKSGHCNICSKSVSNIEIHMWRHTGERPLKCELCTSSFYELKALGRHMNFKHKKTDKYKCDVEGCFMSFPSRPMLTVHTAKVHSTEIPFPCDRCSRRFYRKSDLTRHKIGTHKERVS